jgi:hypothetical protein
VPDYSENNRGINDCGRAGRMLNRPQGACRAMRGTFVTFAMIASLITIWWVVHWAARLIVTEYGALGALVACAVCFVSAVMMDRYGL